MNPLTPFLVEQGINLAFQLLATYLNKPEGWKPTPQDFQDFLDTQDAATPENVKVEAMRRLGLTERIPYTG